MFLLEHTNHVHEIHIVNRFIISSREFIFSLRFLAWKAPRFCVIHPNWFQSIWGLCLLLRPWFPTCGISLVLGKMRSGSILIPFYSSQMAHNMVMHLGKLSTHLIYILSQEGNWIKSIVFGNLSLCFCLDTRVLKRCHP
jgi:hypothetical protein